MSQWTVTLPWPADALSRNARVHRMVLAAANKRARADANWQAKAAGIRRGCTGDRRVTVRCVIHKRSSSIDDDNAIGWMKAYLDGIADALGINDNAWRISFVFEPPVPGGKVVVEISA